MNPFLAGLFKRFGHLPTLVIYKTLICLLVWFFVMPEPWGEKFIAGFIAIYAVVIWNNLRQIFIYSR